MRTEIWDSFNGLVASSPRLLATVTAHNTDGTSSLTTYDGAQARAIGHLSGTIPYNVWVQDGRVVELGPNLPLTEVTI